MVAAAVTASSILVQARFMPVTSFISTLPAVGQPLLVAATGRAATARATTDPHVAALSSTNRHRRSQNNLSLVKEINHARTEDKDRQ